jgi:hypothetical protein
VRYAWILLLVAVAAGARENPFKPVIDETVLPVTSNKVPKFQPFTGTTIRLPDDARVLKSVVIEYQALDGSIQTVRQPVNRAIDWHIPLRVEPDSKLANIPKRKTDKPRTFRPFSFIAVRFEGRRILITTKDPMIRHFHLNHPFKIAIDFKRDAAFLSRHYAVGYPPYVALDLGNHEGYYRVVVTFDAPYHYTLQPTKEGYEILLR